MCYTCDHSRGLWQGALAIRLGTCRTAAALLLSSCAAGSAQAQRVHAEPLLCVWLQA